MDEHESQVLLQFPKNVQTRPLLSYPCFLWEHKAFHGSMGDINSPQSAWGAPSGAHAQNTSPGRYEGAILTKCLNLLNRLLLTRSGSLSESASQETHFSRLCWSSNSCFFHYTRQLRSCTVLPVRLLFPSPFTGDQVTGISVGCQRDAER